MHSSFRVRSMVPALLLTLAGCSSSPTDSGGPPTGLAASASGATTVHVTWSAGADVDEYILERAPGAAGTFAEIARPSGAATSYDDTGLAPSTAYRYRLAAVRGNTTSGFSTAVSITTQAPQQVNVTADITTNTTWAAGNVYRLVGFRKVANGVTLTIEPGTRIVGDFATVGSSLFVMKGARLIANGTAEAPIVFTSSQPEGQRQPGDWGGLIIIGNGIINRSGTVNIEGTGTSAENPLVPYSGGSNNADNSGSLRYVRVEYAGFAPAQDAELNSFTLAAVGSGTTLDYLESLNGLDDSFEFFGGAVDARHLVSYESGDDHFDMSEGYSGRIQFVIGYQSRLLIPRPGAGNTSADPQGIENDGCEGAGCTNGRNTTPYTTPVVANFTLIGTNDAATSGSSGGVGVDMRSEIISNDPPERVAALVRNAEAGCYIMQTIINPTPVTREFKLNGVAFDPEFAQALGLVGVGPAVVVEHRGVVGVAARGDDVAHRFVERALGHRRGVVVADDVARAAAVLLIVVLGEALPLSQAGNARARPSKASAMRAMASRTVRPKLSFHCDGNSSTSMRAKNASIVVMS